VYLLALEGDLVDILVKFDAQEKCNGWVLVGVVGDTSKGRRRSCWSFNNGSWLGASRGTEVVSRRRHGAVVDTSETWWIQSRIIVCNAPLMKIS
jgi:hypothetical protein